MINITIDNHKIQVAEGATVMQAAASVGIVIPSMCYREGHTNHPSCMVCMVKDQNTGKFQPSCALPAAEGMNINTNSEDVKEARKEALELLLSDHAGDCEAPCRLTCPANMNIPLMNRLIDKRRFDEALKVVREDIALPLILGYICPAPCEKACRRKQVDKTISICMLKRFTAQDDAILYSGLETPVNKSGKKVAVIGSGPAGLAAAFYLLRLGHECVVFEKNEKPGGTMLYHIPDSLLPKDKLEAEIEAIKRMGAIFKLNELITKERFENHLIKDFDSVIIAAGTLVKQEYHDFGLDTDGDDLKFNKNTLETNRKGVFICGNSIRAQQMAVKAVAQGKTVAYSVDSYLKGIDPVGHKHKFNSAFGKLFEDEFLEYLKESTLEERKEPEGGFLGGFTIEEAVNEAKRCMHCGCRKPVSCKLRLYADVYHADRKRFLGPDRKHIKKSVLHEFVIYETEKCIRCGLCIEITQREGEPAGLTYVGRGFDVRIDVPFNQTIKEALVKTAEMCIVACPTGALSFNCEEETLK